MYWLDVQCPALLCVDTSAEAVDEWLYPVPLSCTYGRLVAYVPKQYMCFLQYIQQTQLPTAAFSMSPCADYSVYLWWLVVAELLCASLQQQQLQSNSRALLPLHYHGTCMPTLGAPCQTLTAGQGAGPLRVVKLAALAILQHLQADWHAARPTCNISVPPQSAY